MTKRAVGLAAGVAAAAALAFAGGRVLARRDAGEAEPTHQPEGEARMWRIVAGLEPAEQVVG